MLQHKKVTFSIPVVRLSFNQYSITSYVDIQNICDISQDLLTEALACIHVC